MTPANKGKKFPPEVLAERDIKKLLKVCGDDFHGRRAHCWITLMWRTGMRVAEAAGLRRCDADLATQTVRILSPKGVAQGKKPRVLGLDRTAIRAIEGWLEKRNGRGGQAPLLITLGGANVPTVRLRETLPRLAQAAGLRGRRITPHMFRHTFAFECVLEGRPIPWISKALGHSSLIQTQNYLDHVAPADVIDDMKER